MSFYEILKYLRKEVITLPSVISYYLCGFFRRPQACVDKMHCQAHPYLYWIKLEEIKFNGMIEISKQNKQFCSGKAWEFPEKHLRPSVFEEIGEEVYRWSVHETIRNLFLESKEASATPQYRVMAEKYKKHGKSNLGWRCENMNDVDELFIRMKGVFSDMKANGYKVQTELGLYNLNEIQLYIDENGGFLKGVGGNHRILMAEIIGLKWVPVVIRGAHHDFVLNLCKQYNCSPYKALSSWVNQNKLIKKNKPK